MSFRRLLTFDDVGLIPKFNNIASRLSTSVSTVLGKTTYNSPFIPANMDTVIGPELAEVCRARKAPIIFHRFAPIDVQLQWFRQFPEAFMSIGLNSDAELASLRGAGCRRFCIDIAHGHSQKMIALIEGLKAHDEETEVIAGNVCTAEGVFDLAEAGADIIKVGVGPGAACTTRMMTGVGVPQFSAVMDCAEAKRLLVKEGQHIQLIADGGIKHPRDACLAIAAGADAVMMGSVFARTFESATKKEERDGVVWGRYRGQASSEFMQEYFGSEKLRQPEGVAFDVRITQSATDIFDFYEGGLRSSLTYLGAKDIDEYRAAAEFFEATQSYMHESNSRKN
jgi:IMP dehydrogenase